jgi:hypothetical protein
MSSAEVFTLARCGSCGREFDNRRFQVFVVGTQGMFRGAGFALWAAAGKASPARPRAGDRTPSGGALLY